MTTKVKITNDSSISTDSKHHLVKVVNKGGTDVANLKPGESYEGDVHDGESFTVSEAASHD